MRLIDSHCHLNAERFNDDAAAVLERARAAGVERILVPGWNVASSRRALELVESFDWLDASVGVHPHDAARVDAAGWQEIVAAAVKPRVVAIGETGLDYDRVFSPIPEQLMNLRRNLELALETGKPAILHVRSPNGRSDAQDAIVEELRAAGFGAQRSVGVFGADRPAAVIHSFSGTVEYARRVLELGLAISISGLAFRPGEESTADVVPLVPADRLLVETDSPFLSPPGGPRGRNEPEWVRITAAWVGDRRGDDSEAADGSFVAAYDDTFGRASGGHPRRVAPSMVGTLTPRVLIGSDPGGPLARREVPEARAGNGRRGTSARSASHQMTGHRSPMTRRIGRYAVPRRDTLATATKTRLQPLGDRVVVKPTPREEMTKSGIVLPDTAKEKPQEGEILAVGPGAFDTEGKRTAMDVKVGQKVLYGKYSGTEFKLDDDELLIVSQKDILAVVGD